MEDNNRALLVVSYGAAHTPAGAKTIGRTEQELAQAFPDRTLYRAWTSDFMRRRAEGMHVDDLTEAAVRMRADGVTDVLVQPVFVICASEYQKVCDAFSDALPAGFERIRIGKPLLASDADLVKLAQILPELPRAAGVSGIPEEDSVTADAVMETQDAAGTEALVFMGHGSASDPSANQVYTALEAELRRQGHAHVVIGTIDGPPGFSHVAERLEELQPERVTLMPLLLTAGAHVLRDMQGDRKGSWKNRIEAAGFLTDAVPKGLAEYAEVRAMFLAHARDADIAPDDALMKGKEAVQRMQKANEHRNGK